MRCKGSFIYICNYTNHCKTHCDIVHTRSIIIGSLYPFLSSSVLSNEY